MPILSIIMPVYNAGQSLVKCIESVLSQQFLDFELLLVNDGSTDNSLEICKRFELDDERVRVFDRENGGPGAARNTGLEYAEGKYLAFVDSDDKIEPDMYIKMINKMEYYNVNTAVCGYIREFYKENLISYKEQVFLTSRCIKGEKDLQINFKEMYLKNYFNLLWNKIYTLDIIQKNKIKFPEHINVGEDLLFNLQYFEINQEIIILEECFYHYIETAGQSLTHKYNPNLFMYKACLFKETKEFVKKSFENSTIEYSIVCQVFLRDCFQVIDQCFQNRQEVKNIIDSEYMCEALKGCKKVKGLFLLYYISFSTKSYVFVRIVSAIRRIRKRRLGV